MSACATWASGPSDLKISLEDKLLATNLRLLSNVAMLLPKELRRQLPRSESSALSGFVSENVLDTRGRLPAWFGMVRQTLGSRGPRHGGLLAFQAC